MLTSEQKELLVSAVRNTAKLEIIPRFRALAGAQVSVKSGFDDLVTEADIAAEKALTLALQQSFPEASVVGEEAVSESEAVLDRVDSDGLVFIIDPIDGTWNYAQGLSIFGVLVAVSYKNETVYGIQYDPVNDDWIEAAKGEGCFYVAADGKRKRLVLDQAVTEPRLVGFISPFQFSDSEVRQRIAGLQTTYARTLSLRCCCHEYRTLVQGGADFFVSPKPRVWDHAAGILCYQEAGGVVAMLSGAPYSPSIRDGIIVAGRNSVVLERVMRDFSEVLSQSYH